MYAAGVMNGGCNMCDRPKINCWPNMSYESNINGGCSMSDGSKIY